MSNTTMAIRGLGVLVLLGTATLWTSPLSGQYVSSKTTVGDSGFASELVLTSDELDLYALDNSLKISWFRRQPNSGSLTWRGATRIEGIPENSLVIYSGKSIVNSPDDENLYVTITNLGFNMSFVASFERLATGELRQLQLLPMSLIRGQRPLAVSPDGSTVYVAAAELQVFSRQPGDGRLTLTSSVAESTGIRALAVAADGATVYAAGFPTFRSYLRGESGQLTLADQWHEFPYGEVSVQGGIDLAFNPEGEIVVMAFSGFISDVFLVRFETLTGGFVSPVGRGARLWGCCDLGYQPMAIHPSGIVYVGWFENNSPHGFVDAVRLEADGAYAHVGGLSEPLAGGLASFFGTLILSADGRHLYLGGFDRQSVARLDVGDDPAQLTFAEDSRDGIDGLQHPQSLVLSASGEALYASTPTALTRLRLSGNSLEQVRTLRLPAPGFGTGADFFAEVELTSDGKLMVVPTSDERRTQLQLVSTDPDTGGLSLLESTRVDALSTIIANTHSEMVLSPDERHVYLLSGSRVEAFELDQSTPQLSSLRMQRFTRPRYLRFDPTGSVGYLAASPTTNNQLLSREPETGLLVEIAAGGEVLEGSLDFIVSPDGRHVYAQKSDSEGCYIAAYKRNQEHSLIGEARSNERLLCAQMRFDPDGRILYVAGLQTGLHMFRRDSRTGRLRHLETLTEDDSNAYLRPSLVAVGPAGSEIITASEVHSLVSLSRRQCVASDANELCLEGGRFLVEVDWLDFQSNQGGGRAVAGAADDSGLFWFFNSDNWELLVKVLNGCSLNSRYWVFSAATTNVGYRLNVTDTLTGQRASYTNPLGTNAAAVTDTDALAVCEGPGSGILVPPMNPPSPPMSSPRAADSPAAAKNSDENLPLRNDRFTARVNWSDFEGNSGAGKVVPLRSNDSGMFYFFAAENWEMLVKVLDGCELNDRFWVFAAATTNVAYTLEVEDTVTGAVSTYSNPLGRSSPAIIDTDAFTSCDP